VKDMTQTNTERFRVQAYTQRNDGTTEFCVCDFAREAENGLSPIIRDDRACIRTWTDRNEAERVAAEMNQIERRDAVKHGNDRAT
jgi:hypothetical protein